MVGDDPLLMLTAVVPATRRVLQRAGLGKLDPRGGAIALGHPPGTSGTRILATMVNHLEQTGGRYGLQTMCQAGGLANATIIEKL